MADGTAARAEDMVARRRAGQSLAEIGKAHGVTKERARQIINRWLFPDELEALDEAWVAKRGRNGRRGQKATEQTRRRIARAQKQRLRVKC